MSITSYSELKAAVLDWGGNNDVTDASDVVTLAEARIYRELRVRQMETSLSETIASGVISVPSGFLELKNAYIDYSGSNKLTRKSAEWIYLEYPDRSIGGLPQFIARDGSNFIFGPYPNSNYTVKGTYYKKLDPLSDSNTSNWLITDVPDLILAASVAQLMIYIQHDQQLAKWESIYQQTKLRVQSADRLEEMSGSFLMTSMG